MTQTELLALSWVRRTCRNGHARDLRLQAGLSQSELGTAVEVTVPTLSRWESGQRQPTGDAALRYAAMLKKIERDQRRLAVSA